MENTFDFYTIEVISDKITPLKKAGIAKSSITTERSGWKHYGRWPNIKSYPVYLYHCTVLFLDAPGTTTEAVNAAEQKVKAAYPGLRVHVRYHARD